MVETENQLAQVNERPHECHGTARTRTPTHPRTHTPQCNNYNNEKVAQHGLAEGAGPSGDQPC